MQLAEHLVSRSEDTGENSVLTIFCDGLVGLYGNIVYCTAVLKLLYLGCSGMEHYVSHHLVVFFYQFSSTYIVI